MLNLDRVTASYGSIPALRDVSLEVRDGEVVALLGANGAGKTTTLRCIVGLLRPQGGRVTFRGEDITRRSTVEVVRKGVSMVFEGRRVFPELTVWENLLIGGYLVKEAGERQRLLAQMLDRFPRLAERKGQLAGSLSGGEQQMLAMARALMSRPSLLLLDEPSMGLAPKVVDEVFDIIVGLHREGTTILLVEQNAARALEIADRAYVLETGSIVLQGTAKDLLDDPTVRRAYLGR
ncbi:MAG: ABC transporter ATP-binding protein [Bacillota bacterium]